MQETRKPLIFGLISWRMIRGLKDAVFDSMLLIKTMSATTTRANYCIRTLEDV